MISGTKTSFPMPADYCKLVLPCRSFYDNINGKPPSGTAARVSDFQLFRRFSESVVRMEQSILSNDWQHPYVLLTPLYVFWVRCASRNRVLLAPATATHPCWPNKLTHWRILRFHQTIDWSTLLAAILVCALTVVRGLVQSVFVWLMIRNVSSLIEEPNLRLLNGN